MSTAMLQLLPEEALQLIAQHLPPPDVLSFLSTHPTLRRLCLDARFWMDLQKSQYGAIAVRAAAGSDTCLVRNNGDAQTYWKESKDEYLLKAHCHYLPVVKWLHIMEDRNSPTAREGHLACRMGNYMVITGGFADDDSIYVKDLTTGDRWQRIIPSGALPSWVYGATLTALDANRAVRFGGFQAGGYSAETAQVAKLVLARSSEAGVLHAIWEIVQCCFPDGSAIPADDHDWTSLAGRAYHSATLIKNRYLFIVGGMQSSGCCLNPLLLDTETWTWEIEDIATGGDMHEEAPSPRHGHSVVTDLEKRGRLMLFGGGDGNDLLRSGRDNTEVWELHLNGCSAADDPRTTMPWVWRKLHDDQPNPDTYEAVEYKDDSNPNRLTPVEKLNLGRCHGGFRVNEHTVLLAFGSGRPTTNSVLGYHLDQDRFFRPAVQGLLPIARFTFASACLEDLGYLVFHGGYSVQTSGAIANTCVLDLAPGMKREFRLWSVDQRARESAAVTDEQALSMNALGGAGYGGHVIRMLLSSPPADRQAVAGRMLAHLQATQALGGRPAMFLHLIATGRMQLSEDGSLRGADLTGHGGDGAS